MAVIAGNLSRVNYTSGVLPQMSDEDLSPSITSVVALPDLELEASESLNGATIYVQPYLTVPNSAPITPEETPSTGFYGEYSDSAAFDLVLQCGESNEAAWGLSVVRVTPASATEFTLEVDLFLLQDLLGCLPEAEADREVSPGAQLTLSTVDSVAPFDVKIPSIYNRERELVLLVGYDKGAGDGLQAVTYRMKLRAAHWNRDFDGTLEGDLSRAAFRLEYGGDSTAYLRTEGTNTVHWRVRSDFTPVSAYKAGLWRTDAPGVGATIVDAMDFQMVESPNKEILSTIPRGVISNVSNVTDEGAGLYSGSFDVDGTQLLDGGRYIPFINLHEVTGRERVALPPFPGVLTVGLPAPTQGTITTGAASFDASGKIWTTDCLSGVAPLERLLLCATMDKTTYNNMVYFNRTVGNFDANFGGVIAYSALGDPGSIETILENGTPLEASDFTDEDTQFTACTSFRVPESWAGTTGYFYLVFRFNYARPGRDYSDYIAIRFKITVGEFVDPLDASPAVVFDGFEDEDGNPIAAPSLICLSSTDTVRACFTLDGALTGSEYSFVPLINIFGQEPSEHDPYTHPNLPRLTHPAVLSADADFSSGNQACVTLKVSELLATRLYCITALAKGGADVAPPDPPAATCPDFDITYEARTSVADENSFDLFAKVTVDNLSIGGANIVQHHTTVLMSAPGSSQLLDIIYSAIGGADAQLTMRVYDNSAMPVRYITLRFITTVEIENGGDACLYTYAATLPIPAEVGYTFNETTGTTVTP